MHNDDEWGNIPLSGITDEELFRKDWEKSAREKDKWKNSPNSEKRRKNIAKGVKERNKNPEYFEKLATGISQRDNTAANKKLSEKHKDKEWQSKLIESALASRETQEYWDNYNAGIEKRNSNPEWQKNVRAGGLKKSPPVSTPYGDWDHMAECLRDLEKQLGVKQATIRSWFHKKTERYKYWVIKTKGDKYD